MSLPMSFLPSEAARSSMTAEGGGCWTPGLATQQSTSGITSTLKSTLYHSSIPYVCCIAGRTQPSTAEYSLFRVEHDWCVQLMGMPGTCCSVKLSCVKALSSSFTSQAPNQWCHSLKICGPKNMRPRVHEAYSHYCVDAQASTRTCHPSKEQHLCGLHVPHCAACAFSALCSIGMLHGAKVCHFLYLEIVGICLQEPSAEGVPWLCPDRGAAHEAR